MAFLNLQMLLAEGASQQQNANKASPVSVTFVGAEGASPQQNLARASPVGTGISGVGAEGASQRQHKKTQSPQIQAKAAEGASQPCPKETDDDEAAAIEKEEKELQIRKQRLREKKEHEEKEKNRAEQIAKITEVTEQIEKQKPATTEARVQKNLLRKLADEAEDKYESLMAQQEEIKKLLVTAELSRATARINHVAGKEKYVDESNKLQMLKAVAEYVADGRLPPNRVPEGDALSTNLSQWVVRDKCPAEEHLISKAVATPPEIIKPNQVAPTTAAPPKIISVKPKEATPPKGAQPSPKCTTTEGTILELISGEGKAQEKYSKRTGIPEYATELEQHWWRKSPGTVLCTQKSRCMYK